MSSKFLAELSNDYEKLFKSEIGYDVIIYVGEELNVKEIHAHSNILCIRSQYFCTTFSNEWAEKKDGKFILRKPNIPLHLFNIILSRDGFDAASFHRNCDSKGTTIWIAKIQGSTQLIGGYNPLDWKGRGAKYSADSFLFNFTDGKDISTAKLGYANNKNCLVYCYNTQGPSMGELNCPDSNNWFVSAGNTHYPNIGIPSTFTVENYEVFQVIRR
ncbi:unnamed protein product [Rhizophagus irregularis]|nr:unnamed protein product [Rhizophagus irregularis]